MRVLVTGGRGFLGQHLVRRLMREPSVDRIVRVSRQGFDSHQLLEGGRMCGQAMPDDARCELTDARQVRSLMQTHVPDVVFHLAADPVIKADEEHPFKVSQANVMGTHHLLEYCPSGTRFVLASSAAVYGEKAVWGAEESQLPTPSSVYGATKVAAESLCYAYAELRRISYVALRLVANAGRGASHGVVRDLVTKLLSDAPELELLGDEPGSAKHYAYAPDTAQAFAHFGLNPGYNRDVFNVAPDDFMSVAEVARAVMDAAGVSKPIRWLGEGANWRGDNRTVRVNNNKARRWGYATTRTSYEAVYHGAKDMLGKGSSL